MAGLDPAIHVFLLPAFEKTWMPGTRPGMTTQKKAMTRNKSYDLPKRLSAKRTDAETDKTRPSETGNPFATFFEWSNDADEKAYTGSERSQFFQHAA